MLKQMSVVIVLVLCLAGCDSAEDKGGTPSTTPTPSVTATPTPVATPVITPVMSIQTPKAGEKATSPTVPVGRPADLFDALRDAVTSAGITVDTKAILYTCPMHPDVLQSEPGKCPTCGMVLVPKMVPIPEAK